METPLPSLEQPKKRPTFLKVLCILTFICVGIELAGSLFQIPDTFFKTAQEQVDEQTEKLAQVEQMMPGITDRVTDMILELAPYKIPSWLMAFFGNLLTLYAAILMWKLKKRGFYLYIFAELVPFIISVFFFKAMKAMTGMFSAFGAGMESMGITIMVVIVLFDLAFIGMYAANLKHME